MISNNFSIIISLNPHGIRRLQTINSVMLNSQLRFITKYTYQNYNEKNDMFCFLKNNT